MTTQNWFAEAPPLPFFPFKGMTKEELGVLFTGYKARANRKRSRPPLALALVGLLTSLSALLASSPQGEETLASWVPTIKKTVDQAEMAIAGSSARTLSLNESGSR